MTQRHLQIIIARTHMASAAGWKARKIDLSGGYRVRIEFLHPATGAKVSARGFVPHMVFVEALNQVPLTVP